MPDKDTIDLLIKSGGFVFAAVLLWHLSNRLLTFMLGVWKDEMQSQKRAHEYQRKEHAEVKDSLDKAHLKLDIIVQREK